MGSKMDSEAPNQEGRTECLHLANTRLIVNQSSTPLATLTSPSSPPQVNLSLGLPAGSSPETRVSPSTFTGEGINIRCTSPSPH
jgi:hypothetical protein